MRLTGLKRGVPDIFMAIPSKGYHGLFLELKSDCGKATPEQMQFLKALADKGYACIVAHGLDSARCAIKDYLEGIVDVKL